MKATRKTEAERFYGWRMVRLAFLASSAGLALVLQSFGPAMPVLQRELAASRAGVSTAFGLVMLMMGVLAPLVGNVTHWVRLRTLMMAGAAMNMLGFLLLAFAGSLSEVLLLYGLVIGPGSCVLALVSAPTLISRWFERDRGKALSLGLVQVAGLVVAPLAAWLLSLGGRWLLYLTMAAMFATLIPLMSRVIDWPESVGQTPRRADFRTSANAMADRSVKSSGDIFADSRFWLLSLAAGIFTGAGVAFGSHGPAMAVAKGASPAMAATVLSGLGAGTLLGAFGFGWLIDRVGAFRSLVIALFLYSAVWAAFAAATNIWLMVFLGFLLGFSLGPSTAVHTSCLNELFGSATLSRAIGYSYLIKSPFLLGSAPLAGHLYDLSGNYHLTSLVYLSALTTATIMAVALAAIHQRRIARDPPTNGRIAADTPAI